jgi:site-specific recombinase XerD
MSPRHARVQFTAPVLEDLERDRALYKSAHRASNTLLSYQRDFRVFTAWCEAAERPPSPASEETVELYVTDLLRLGRKISTVERHMAGIQHTHRERGYLSPCGAELRKLLAGARRTLCQKPTQKEALSTRDLRALVRAIDVRTPIGARDAAVLLFGFASALRRSNLAALELGQLIFTAEGIVVRVGREKQNPEGGRQLPIPRGKRRATCPVRAIERWLAHRGKAPGPLFTRVLNGHPDLKPLLGSRIAQIVQEAVARVGLDRARYAGHSLRAGMASEALANGADPILVARHTGHASLDTLRIYVRPRNLFLTTAAKNLGL